MPGNLKQKYILLFLAFITLALFFNTLGSQKFYLDDVPIIDEFLQYNYSARDLLRIDQDRPYSFIYGDTFRPMFGLSLWLDFQIWFDEISGYHLTNILIHLVNVLLLFFFTKLLLEQSEKKKKIAFIAALIFAIHPIHTESVDWIVGRQDPMAALFLLSSFILYLKWRSWKGLLYPLFIGLFFFAGLSSREITVVFIPLIILYEAIVKFKNNEPQNSKFLFFKPLALIILLTIIFAAFSNIQEIYSSRNFNQEERFATLISYIKDSSIITLIFENSAYIGFYFWKLFYPFPLNFALSKIDLTFYFVFFCFLSPIAIFYSKKERILFFLAIAVFISLLPSLPARFFSWTVVAERYLYIPSIFFSILAANIFIEISFAKYARILKALIVVIFIFLSMATLTRNYQWQDNARFWKNAVKKSPDSGTAWSNYAHTLAQNFKIITSQKKNISLIKKAPGYKYTKPIPEANISYIKKVIEKATDLGDKKGYLLFVQLSIFNNDLASTKYYISRINREDFKSMDTILALGNSYEFLGKKESDAKARDAYYTDAVNSYKSYLQHKKNDYYIALKSARLLNLLSKNEEALAILNILETKKEVSLAIKKGAKRLHDKIKTKKS